MNRLFSVGLLLLVFLALGREGAWAEEPAVASSKTYTLFASGDTQLGRWTPSAVYANGPDWPLGETADLVRSADVAMTNLECVVSTKGEFWDKGERRPFLYRAPPDMLDVLTNAGFDVAVTANNHVMDYGPEALLDQLNLLKEVGIASVGSGKDFYAASQPTFVKVDDLVIAFVGIEIRFPRTAATPDRPGAFHSRGRKNVLKAIEAPIKTARQHADLVVFTPHWYSNWTENPDKASQEIARRAIDLGADAVLGHSSHHLHGIEIYQGKPIVHDMGFFLFDRTSQKRMRYSAGFTLDFTGRGFEKLTIHPVMLYRNHTRYARRKDAVHIRALLKQLSKELDPRIRFEQEGETLTLDLIPSSTGTGRPPTTFHLSGTTRKLPSQYRIPPGDVVLSSSPEWAKADEAIVLDNGVRVLGSRTSTAARPGYAFVSEVALRVPRAFTNGHLVATVKGVNRASGEQFSYRHPIADGAWVPEQWQPDQIVIDRSLIRPPKLPPGNYQLLYRMEDTQNRWYALPEGQPRVDEPGYFPIGDIQIVERGIPKRPSGINGYPAGSDPRPSTGITNTVLLIVIALGVLFVAVCTAVYFVRRKRRNR